MVPRPLQKLDGNSISVVCTMATLLGTMSLIPMCLIS